MSSHVYNLKISFKYSQRRNGNPYMMHNPGTICLLLIPQHPLFPLLASLHSAATPGFSSSTTILGLPWYSDGKESACNAGDPGLIPGPGRSPGEGMANHTSILIWRIPWTEEPGGLQSKGPGISKSLPRLSN